MPGTTPPTSQLEWLSSTTAMIVLFWSRATRDLLRSFGWGIAALHRENAATKLPFLAARPIASFGTARERDGRGEGDLRPTIVVSRDPCLNDPHPAYRSGISLRQRSISAGAVCSRLGYCRRD